MLLHTRTGRVIYHSTAPLIFDHIFMYIYHICLYVTKMLLQIFRKEGMEALDLDSIPTSPLNK